MLAWEEAFSYPFLMDCASTFSVKIWKKMHTVREKMEGMVFTSRHSLHFMYIVILVKMNFLIRTLTWRVNIYVLRQGRGMKKRN